MSFPHAGVGGFALTKGYGKRHRINNLITAFWQFTTMSSTTPWFERVSSKANWADSVSRQDWTLCTSQGLVRLHIRLNDFWPLIKQVALDQSFAAGQAASVLADHLQSVVRPQLVQRGWL